MPRRVFTQKNQIGSFASLDRYVTLSMMRQTFQFWIVISGQSSSTFSNEGIADDFLMLPHNNFVLNGERSFPEVGTNSCSGYCSGHSDECLSGQSTKDRLTTQEPRRSLNILTEHAPVDKQSCTRSAWISPRPSYPARHVDNTEYFNVDENDEPMSRRKYGSPEIPLVKGETVFDATSGRSVDFEKACKVRKTGKHHHPSRDQETQTLHETASAFTNTADSLRAREFIEMSRQNHSPAVKLQAGNSFQLLPTFIPVPSDPSGTCFVSPTLGYPVSAPGHPSLAPMPSTTHVFHPGNARQDHFVYLASQMYPHVPHGVSTVYTPQGPSNVNTVGSPSALPFILAPGRMPYKGPHAPMPNYAIPGPAFVPSSSPGPSMVHNQPGNHGNTYRQYLMRPGSHVLQPMYQ